MVKAQKIRAAAEEFAENNKGYNDPLMQIEVAIGERGAQDEHFDRFKAIYDDTIENLITPINHDYTNVERHPLIKARVAQFRTVGFLPNREEGNQKFVIPSFRSAEMSNSYIVRTERDLPIKLDIQRAEFRFIQNTAKLLEYNSEDTQSSFIMGIAVSHAIGKKLRKDTVRSVEPIVIPNKNGFFIGYAEHQPKDQEVSPIKGHVTVRQAKTNVPITRNIRAVQKFEDYDTLLRLVTFVHPREMSKAQLELWETMREMQSDEKDEQRSGVWAQFQGVDKLDRRTVGIFNDGKPMLREMSKLVRSDLWDHAMDATRERLRERMPGSEEENVGLFRMLGIANNVAPDTPHIQ